MWNGLLKIIYDILKLLIIIPAVYLSDSSGLFPSFILHMIGGYLKPILNYKSE